MPYNNLNRPGLRSSITVDPTIVVEDLDSRVRRLEPEATPMLTLSNEIGRGPAPKSHKIKVMQYHAHDNLDYCSSVTLSSSVNTNYSRFALMTLDQASRPLVSDEMYYYPQDKFFIVSTGQVVEVVMTPDATVQVNGSDFTVPAVISGNTTTRTSADTVLVRNVEPYPIKTFTASDVVFLGRTIEESQDIEATPHQRDFVFDCNFVEHKEKVLIFTEDQKNLVMTKGQTPDWTFQQKEMLSEFKKEVESNFYWSERQMEARTSRRPIRHMRGLFNTIRTNVMYYDPATVTDFEQLLANFMHEQAFRYNPGARYEKLGLAGSRVLFNFNMAFREYRRTSGLDNLGKKVGLDIDTYSFGPYRLGMVRNEALRQNTNMEDWMFVIDPSLAELRVKKNFTGGFYANNNERDIKYYNEWQGTIAWHLEQAHSLIRTV